MKDIKRIIPWMAVVSLMVTACQEAELREDKDLSVHEQAILHGVIDMDEPYVVALFSPDKAAHRLTLCNETNTAACREESGENTACVFVSGDHVCVPQCPAEGRPANEVCVDMGDYAYRVTQKCQDIDGVSVYADDYSTVAFCNKGCNADGTACAEGDETDYKLCDSDRIRTCKEYYGDVYTCVQNKFDSADCVRPCSVAGEETQVCERTEAGYVTSKYLCTAAFGGNVNILQKSYDCDGGCNSDRTDCVKRVKPSFPGLGGQSSGSAFCTGTLIHPEWVLTAAHCITDDDDNGNVWASDRNLSAQIGFGFNEKSLKLYDSKGPDFFYYHEGYAGVHGNVLADIALIRLQKPVSASDAEPVLPLPPWLAFTSEDMPADMQVSGFGYDERGNIGTKRKMDLPTSHYCGKYNPDDSRTDGCPVGNVTVEGCHPNPSYCDYYGYFHESDEMTTPYASIFATINEGGQCNGDSGGPTFYSVGGKRYVVGVTSYGDAPCRGFNVSTSVQDYYDWIVGIAPEVANGYTEVCDNGLDDDNNGFVDNEDPNCDYCGNHAVNGEEQCDDAAFAEDRTQCAQWDEKYVSGSVTCRSDCTIDVSACVEAKCGDGIVSRDEVCDGSAFLNDESSCHALFADRYWGGSVTCSDDCGYDTTGCVPYCGNGVIDEDEACDHGADGDVLPSDAVCEILVGRGSTGTVSCSEDCQSVVSTGCSPAAACGDGKLDDGESCDGTAFAGNKILCSQWDAKYVSGSVSCTGTCEIDVSACQMAPSVEPQPQPEPLPPNPPVEICGNGIDDDLNGTADCNDPVCAGFEGCQTPVDNSDEETKKASASGCASTPLSGVGAPLWILGLLGFGLIRRRRRV